MRRRAAWLVALGAAALAGWWLAPPAPRVPAFEAVRAGYRPSDLALVDRHGEVVHEVRVDPTRRRLAWTPLAAVSPALTAAVIESEDRRFYRHGGVDPRALAAAAWQSATGGPRRGGSTLSMQVAALVDRNLRRRGGPRTLGQKWRQMRLAWGLEARWTKAQILEAYLNLAAFRGELEGVAAASALLFDKAPHGLTDAEAAVLAALLRAPNAESETVARRAERLAGTREGAAGPETIRAAVARALAAPRGGAPRVALAPHAAARLFRTARVAGAPRAALEPVRSTLDATLQDAVTATLRRHLLAIRDRHVQDGAALVVTNATGEVLAYVGGSGDLSSARYVDGIVARRQAGSALKPFLYGLALEQRLLTPATRLDDTPLELAVAGGLYRPRNYDEQFQGRVTVRTALASSLNVPAVRTLEVVGAEIFVERLRRLGFDGVTESGDFYGPALALGSADVSLWELVNAYRTLANGGQWSPLVLAPGAGSGPGRRVYSEAVAFLVSDILAGRESRSATFGLENPLATRFWTAVKTGTSKEMRDNWCVGYSRRYTVGVWVGNYSGAPMRDVSGITGAAPIWREVMAGLHRTTASAPPATPAGVVAAGAEWFLAGTEPSRVAEATVVAAGAVPRILSPVAGSVIALDPDIPPARQRVVFELEGRGGAYRWQLDAADLGAATGAVLWEPVAGRHALSLVDGSGRVVESTRFEVRGPASTTPE
jgi:penicillin-binding protein 1C